MTVRPGSSCSLAPAGPFFEAPEVSRLTTLFQAEGPFATVTLDVSRDTENAAQEQELRVRAAGELAGLGAPPEVVEAVSGRLGEVADEPAPVARVAVANHEAVLFDDVLRRLEDSPATVVELESGTRAEDGGDEALQQAIREALLAQSVARRLELSHTLKDRLGRDHAVVTGVR